MECVDNQGFAVFGGIVDGVDMVVPLVCRPRHCVERGGG